MLGFNRVWLFSLDWKGRLMGGWLREGRHPADTTRSTPVWRTNCIPPPGLGTARATVTHKRAEARRIEKSSW